MEPIRNLWDLQFTSIDCVSLFLSVLMQTVKSDIQSERNNVQSQDIVMFFAVANFFTAYQQCLLLKKKVRLLLSRAG